MEALRSSYLSERCRIDRAGSGQQFDNGTADEPCSPRTRPPEPKPYQLYLPAPPDLAVDQAYHYHLATRNCFALAASLPLVGEKLGTALIRTWDRLVEWESDVCESDKMWDYCEEQGYGDFSGLPNHALACLALAEKAQMRNLWIDAFAHCVGQRENLFCSPEYDGISQTTKALIMRASLEMDLHIERVIRALGSFLEEELGSEYLGLSKAAREHLDRFRSCLHHYYVEKLGYFPPKQDTRFNKRMWTKMYHSFHALYDYIVDIESDADLSNTRGMNGGVCVVQNVLAFDQRHGYAPLPHPLPLLPEALALRPAMKRVDTAPRGLLGFKLTRFETVAEKTTERDSLTKATNPEVDVTEYPLIQEYQRFERQRLEEKLSLSEARKVRWLLIYGVLQMLISITRAPEHVRDAEISPYPLCILLAGCPSWADADAEAESIAPSSQASSLLAPPQRQSNEMEDRLSIHPDCEADCAEDFFAAHTLSRQCSDLSLNVISHPVRPTQQLSRTASIRSTVNSGVHAIHRSMVGGLSRRNSLRTSRRHSVASLDLSPCVESDFVLEQSPDARQPDEGFGLFDFGLHMAVGQNVQEPILEFDHLPALDVSTDLCSDTQELARSHSDASSSSALASQTTSSTRSSMLGDYDSPATEVSISWADEAPGGIDGMTKPQIPLMLLGDSFTPTSPSKRVAFQDQMLGVGVYSPYVSSVSVGCYMPTGYSPTVYTPKGTSELSPLKPAKRRTLSGESFRRSSVDETTQEEGHLEEESGRVLPRPRVLDCIDEYDVVDGRDSSLPA